MKISIKVKGGDKIKKNFDEVNKILRNVDPELTKVGKWVLTFLRDDVFETEGQIISSPWKPLKPATLAEKVRKGYQGAGTLERTGTLRKGWRMRLFGNKMIFENAVPYGPYHQQKDFKAKYLPKRKLYNLNDYFRGQVYRKLETELTRKVKKAFNNV